MIEYYVDAEKLLLCTQSKELQFSPLTQLFFSLSLSLSHSRSFSHCLTLFFLSLSLSCSSSSLFFALAVFVRVYCSPCCSSLPPSLAHSFSLSLLSLKRVWLEFNAEFDTLLAYTHTAEFAQSLLLGLSLSRSLLSPFEWDMVEYHVVLHTRLPSIHSIYSILVVAAVS